MPDENDPSTGTSLQTDGSRIQKVMSSPAFRPLNNYVIRPDARPYTSEDIEIGDLIAFAHNSSYTSSRNYNPFTVIGIDQEDGIFEVRNPSAPNGIIRCRDTKRGGLECSKPHDILLIEKAKVGVPMPRLKFRAGNTVIVNSLFEEDIKKNLISRSGYRGVIGKTTGEVVCGNSERNNEPNSQVFVKMDGIYDALRIPQKYLDIVDEDCEHNWRLKARTLRQKAGTNHRHNWTVRWEGTCLECECGVRQWSMGCWTGDTWKFKPPRGLLLSRPDLKESKDASTLPIPEVQSVRPSFRTRSRDLIHENALQLPITIIGAGAIGSFTCLALSKMGFERITVFDPDTVEVENVGTQLYGHRDTEDFKVTALSNLIWNTGPMHSDEDGEDLRITDNRERYTDQETQGIVIMAVDSMAARRTIWENQKGRVGVMWVIDGRMGAEQALTYAMNPNNREDVESYEKTLYTDEAALQEPCTAAGTVYTALLISGWIGKIVKDLVTGNPKYPRVTLWNIKDNQQLVFTKELAAVRTAS